MRARIAIIDGVRTPFCKSMGALGGFGADDLGAVVVTELLARTGLDTKLVDEVIFGNVGQPPHAMNIARVIALKAGLPSDLIAHTVHRNCASGMQSITAAALEIETGRSEIVIAGGTEAMSHFPLIFGPAMTKLFMKLMRARTIGQRLGVLASFRPSYLKPVIALQLGLTDPVCGLNMGQTAEVLAREFGISRQEQDEFALESHKRAAASAEKLGQEIMPVIGPPKYDAIQSADDAPRAEQSMEALAKLKPFFDRHAGTVTPGNSCPITDGAGAVLMMSEDKARELGYEPLGFLTDWAYAALEGSRMGLGPTYATAKLLKQSGRSFDEFGVVELNEAFAAQVLANVRAFESGDFAREHLDSNEPIGRINPHTLNPNGGAIALGHPVGATGTRLVITTLMELRRRKTRHGLATLCIGGGQGAALALEAA